MMFCFFKNYKFIFGRQALRCCAGSLQLQHPGDSSICSVQASHFVAFSRCGVWILGHLCFSGFGHVGSVLAPRLWGADSIVVAQGFSCSQACGIFLDEGLNPCLLYWQADSLPLSHQGSRMLFFDTQNFKILIKLEFLAFPFYGRCAFSYIYILYSWSHIFFPPSCIIF